LSGAIGGLWLQLELASRGVNTILIDHRQLGGFASTRNQSWLHSGAFYAVLGGSLEAGGVAQECLRGSRILKDFCAEHCPEAILKKGCIFAFDTDTAANLALQRIRSLGLLASLTRDGPSTYEPLLSPDVFPFGVLCEECPFDPFPILRSVLVRGARAGGKIYVSGSPLLSSTRTYEDSKWIVNIDGETFRASSLVLAAGALNPRLLYQTIGREMQATVQRSFLCAFRPQITNNILVLSKHDVDGTVMFGPFHGGTTVNVVQRDIDVGSVGEFVPDQAVVRNFASRLRAYMPRLGSHSLHFYTCEKLNNCDDASNPYPAQTYGSRHFFWTREDRKLFTFYPGKFITAPMAAEELAGEVCEQIGDPWRVEERGILSKTVSLAKPRAITARPTHRSYRDANGKWGIEEAPRTVEGEVTM
jgi:glycine/D-amino acid oxidase-like deaminating enzyme